MAYREAKTDKEKKRGKSTDELSFEEALAFFKKRGKEKGATKFRWRGDAYSVSGEKLSSKPPKKSASSSAPKSTSTRPQARPTEGQIRSSSNGRTRYTPPSKDTGSSEKNARDPKNYTSSGRGKGMYELGRRATEQPEYENGKRKQTTTPRFPGLTRIADSFNRLKERLPKSAQADYSSNDEAMKLFDAFKKEWAKQSAKMDTLGPDAKRDLNRIKSMFDWGLNGSPSTGSSGRTQTTSSNYTQKDLDRRSGGRKTGMSKGGMVKSGNKDYKKSGMFYKSGSPRGYK